MPNPNPSDFPDTVFPSGASLELQRLGIFDAKLAYGARFDGTADDWSPLQDAIDSALSTRRGGIILLPPGVGKITANVLSTIAAANVNATLVFQGAGMYNTTLLCGQAFQFNGLFGYQNGNQAQIVVRDLTIDGNYVGLGGTLAQSSGAMVSLPVPFTNAFSVVGPTGVFHHFERVRFYRPSGYVGQTAQACHLHACLFDRCGQPDTGGNKDNLGGGDWATTIVTNCTWKDSTGNFVDYVAGTSGQPPQIIFIGNRSYGHASGGIYGAGIKSVIALNHMQSIGGGGVGYDVGTHAANRSGNIVVHNVFDNMSVLASGLSETSGDIVRDNISSDQGAAVQTVASAATVTLPPGEDFVKISGTANITSVAAARPGRRATLVFTGTAGGTGLTNGSNLKIGANFVYTPDDAITLVSDGTNWYRVAAGAVN